MLRASLDLSLDKREIEQPEVLQDQNDDEEISRTLSSLIENCQRTYAKQGRSLFGQGEASEQLHEEVEEVKNIKPKKKYLLGGKQPEEEVQAEPLEFESIFPI